MTDQGANKKNQGAGKNRDNKSKWPWYGILIISIVVVFFVVLLSIALLVGLPLGALWLTDNKCCSFEMDSFSDLLTFWGAVFAGFLALFSLIISGVFIVTAFKVGQQAKYEAREAAEEEAEKVAEKVAENKVEDIAEDLIKKVASEKAEEVAEREAKKVAPKKAAEVAEEEAKKVALEKAAEVAEKKAKEVAEKTAKQAVEKKDIGKTVQEAVEGITKEKVRQEIKEETRKEAQEQFRKILGEYPFGRRLRPWVAKVFKMLGTEKEKDRPPPKPPEGRKSDKDNQGPGR